MLRRLLTLALFAWAGAACTTDTPTVNAIAYDPCRPVAWVAEGDVSSGQREALDAAITLWQAVLPVGAEGGDASVVPVGFEDAAPFFHGIYLPERGAIIINAQLTGPHELAVTVAHELGHAFGLPHVDDGDGATVMAPGNLVTEPTERDARALEALWGSCVAPVSQPSKLR